MPDRPVQVQESCSLCGGRGWHTAGGNDPAACGACEAGAAWYCACSYMTGREGDPAARATLPTCPVHGDGRLGRFRMRLAGVVVIVDMNPQDPDPRERMDVVDWVSDCCGGQMTTGGGDGSDGSPCWAVCRECSHDCEADPVYEARQDDGYKHEIRNA